MKDKILIFLGSIFFAIQLASIVPILNILDGFDKNY